MCIYIYIYVCVYVYLNIEHDIYFILLRSPVAIQHLSSCLLHTMAMVPMFDDEFDSSIQKSGV